MTMEAAKRKETWAESTSGLLATMMLPFIVVGLLWGIIELGLRLGRHLACRWMNAAMGGGDIEDFGLRF
jgi:hypothetical protein